MYMNKSLYGHFLQKKNSPDSMSREMLPCHVTVSQFEEGRVCAFQMTLKRYGERTVFIMYYVLWTPLYTYIDGIIESHAARGPAARPGVRFFVPA